MECTHFCRLCRRSADHTHKHTQRYFEYYAAINNHSLFTFVYKTLKTQTAYLNFTSHKLILNNCKPAPNSVWLLHTTHTDARLHVDKRQRLYSCNARRELTQRRHTQKNNIEHISYYTNYARNMLILIPICNLE